MDDQIDGKTLLGSYVCSERPGEFRWQPGSLTQVCFLLDNSCTNIYSSKSDILPPSYIVFLEKQTY